MKMARLRQPAVGALAVLFLSGGIALAANPAAPPAAPPAADAAPAAEPATEPVEPVGADRDNLQEGDQTTPDSAAEQAAEEAETESEKAGAEEPGDANLPGGGHADDAKDPNADHQFEGEE